MDFEAEFLMKDIFYKSGKHFVKWSEAGYHPTSEEVTFDLESISYTYIHRISLNILVCKGILKPCVIIEACIICE
jgi:hypothetical protein